MKQEILDYVNSQRVGVLAIEMLDGSPHASTVHFANTNEPFVFYFETERPYLKSETLLGRKVSRASFVVGTDETTKITFQLDGTVEILKPEEMEAFSSVYFEKFPKKKDKLQDPKNIFFKFTPTWWRFTDWTNPQGKTITTSPQA